MKLDAKLELLAAQALSTTEKHIEASTAPLPKEFSAEELLGMVERVRMLLDGSVAFRDGDGKTDFAVDFYADLRALRTYADSLVYRSFGKRSGASVDTRAETLLLMTADALEHALSVVAQKNPKQIL